FLALGVGLAAVVGMLAFGPQDEPCGGRADGQADEEAEDGEDRFHACEHNPSPLGWKASTGMTKMTGSPLISYPESLWPQIGIDAINYAQPHCHPDHRSPDRRGHHPVALLRTPPPPHRSP